MSTYWTPFPEPIPPQDRAQQIHLGMIYGFCPACGAARTTRMTTLANGDMFTELVCSMPERHEGT